MSHAGAPLQGSQENILQEGEQMAAIAELAGVSSTNG